jgi:hypothetical protein
MNEEWMSQRCKDRLRVPKTREYNKQNQVISNQGRW